MIDVKSIDFSFVEVGCNAFRITIRASTDEGFKAEELSVVLKEAIREYGRLNVAAKKVSRLEKETEKHAKAYREAQELLEKARKEYKELVK